MNYIEIYSVQSPTINFQYLYLISKKEVEKGSKKGLD